MAQYVQVKNVLVILMFNVSRQNPRASNESSLSLLFRSLLPNFNLQVSGLASSLRSRRNNVLAPKSFNSPCYFSDLHILVKPRYAFDGGQVLVRYSSGACYQN